MKVSRVAGGGEDFQHFKSRLGAGGAVVDRQQRINDKNPLSTHPMAGAADQAGVGRALLSENCLPHLSKNFCRLIT